MKTKIVLWFCIFLSVLITQKCYSQNQQKIDSLLNVLKTAKEDTNKVNVLNELGNLYEVTGDYPVSLKYSEESVKICNKLILQSPDTLLLKVIFKDKINALNNLGIIKREQGDFTEALHYHFDALKIAEENKIPSVATQNAIAVNYSRQGNFAEALKNYFAALKTAEEIGDKKLIAGLYNNIGTIYGKQNNNPEALKSFSAALKIKEELGDKRGMANSYNNIGLIIGEKMNQYPEGLKNFNEGLKLYQEIGDKAGMIKCFDGIGSVYERMGNFSEALSNHLSALRLSQEINNKGSIASNLINVGIAYDQLGNYQNAIEYLKKGLFLAQEIGAKERIMEAYLGLSDIYGEKKDFANALKYFKLNNLMKDTLLNEANNKQINEMKAKYESEKKEKEIALLTKDKVIQSTEIKKQKVLKYSLIGGIGLMLILVFLGYRTYRTRQLLKLQTLRNKIASDLHDEVGSTLSSISIFSEIAKEQSSEVSPMLEQIGDSSRKMLDAMADIVWTINPENDQFEKIILRMKSFAYELLGAKKIDFEFEADENVSEMKLPMDVRKNLYLIFKEATNNMVKYAEANKASFSISGNKEKLTMFIRDNGKGFDVNKESQGNGLKNMKKRAQEIGANLLIESEAGMGTTLQLILNLA